MSCSWTRIAVSRRHYVPKLACALQRERISRGGQDRTYAHAANITGIRKDKRQRIKKQRTKT